MIKTTKITKKETVLLTGGAGFMGSHIAQDLINLGYKVIVIDNLSGGFRDNIPEGAKFIKCDVREVNKIKEIFEKNQIDYVFHLAAYAAEGLSHFIRRFNYENNLIGSVSLINESIKHKVKCFVFTSSIAVYGTNQLPMEETTIPMPEDPYGISKYAVELDLKAAYNMFGLNYIIFRPHNVYGEKQNIGDKYRNVIGIFMNNILQGKPMTIFGDGKQTRAFSYIGDVSPIIAKSIRIKKAYNQVFNIGADKPYTVLKLAQTVANVMGVELNIKFLRARKEVKHAYSDHSKVKKILGYEAKCGLESGLKNMYEWVKKAGSKKTPEFKNIEVKENLPEGW